MGTIISTVKGEIESAHQKLDEQRQAEEQLAILEKMAKSQLLNKSLEILHGTTIDKEIHAGVVVAKHQQIFVDAVLNADKEDGIEGNFKEIVDGIFNKDAKGITSGAMNLILSGVKEFLGNYAIGESETQDMVIIWSNNVLLRVDLYYWKWSFSQAGVFHHVKKNILAVYCVKRVIGIADVQPSVVIWAISNMYAKRGLGDEEALEYAEDILKRIEEVKKNIKEISDSEY